MDATLSPSQAKTLDAFIALHFSIPDLLATLKLSATEVLDWLAAPPVAATLDTLRAALDAASDLRTAALRDLSLSALARVVTNPPNPAEARRAATKLFDATTPRSSSRLRASQDQSTTSVIHNPPATPHTPAANPLQSTRVPLGTSPGHATSPAPQSSPAQPYIDAVHQSLPIPDAGFGRGLDPAALPLSTSPLPNFPDRPRKASPGVLAQRAGSARQLP